MNFLLILSEALSSGIDGTVSEMSFHRKYPISIKHTQMNTSTLVVSVKPNAGTFVSLGARGSIYIVTMTTSTYNHSSLEKSVFESRC